MCSLPCALGNLPHLTHLNRGNGDTYSVVLLRGFGYSPCLAPFHDTAFLLQLAELVCGLVFEFGGNMVRELDERELKSMITVALKGTGR